MDQDLKSEINITITDLKNVLVLIDLITQRGALRGSELSSVATLYEKINQFVSETEKKMKKESDGSTNV